MVARALQYIDRTQMRFAAERSFLESLLRSDAMKTKTALISTAVTSVLALGMFSMSVQAADDANTEKCYGIAKAGKNDCAANGHACAGQSTTSSNAKEWVKLPAGTCERIVGGSTTAK
jgi:uncharacterized membrane protein